MVYGRLGRGAGEIGRVGVNVDVDVGGYAQEEENGKLEEPERVSSVRLRQDENAYARGGRRYSSVASRVPLEAQPDDQIADAIGPTGEIAYFGSRMCECARIRE